MLFCTVEGGSGLGGGGGGGLGVAADAEVDDAGEAAVASEAATPDAAFDATVARLVARARTEEAFSPRRDPLDTVLAAVAMAPGLDGA